MKNNRHTAIVQCNKCKQYIISEGGGRFRSCKCGNYVDQERWSGAYARYGGDVTFIEQICPANCQHKKQHQEEFGNKTIEECEDLQEYLKLTYGYESN